MIRRESPDYLIVPMSRSFGGDCWCREDWHLSKKGVYAKQVKRAGVTSFLINGLESGTDGSFGGALIIASSGDILAELVIGQEGILIYQVTPNH